MEDFEQYTQYPLRMPLLPQDRRCALFCWLSANALRAALLCATGLLSGQPYLRAQVTGSTQALPNAPQSTGTVTGTVVDATDARISGAVITLKTGDFTRATSSTADGSFVFTDVPVGTFSVTAALKGFAPASSEGTLSAGQIFAVPDLSMKMAEVDLSVNALTSKELAQLEVKAEEEQRVLGVLPNFFVAYDWHAQPLTPKQKFSLVVTTFRDPINIILAGGAAGVQQWQNDFAGYGQGAQGYGKRFGANYGGLVIGTMLGGGVFPVLLHQDPRYFYKGSGSVHGRLFYALSRAVIARGDDGKSQPAYASLLGDLSAGAISNAYYPAGDRSSVGVTFENGLIGIGGDAISNVFQEFIVRRFTPKSRRGVVNAVTTQSTKQ